MAPNLHVIFNPVSGQGNAQQELAKLEAALQTLGTVSVHMTEPNQDARTLTHRALEQGADWVVASGGDGTVSAVASILAHSSIPLGIIPRGTANVFARSLGIPTAVSEACEVLQTGQPKQVDAAQCNDRFMLLLVCVGFEADLLNELSREKKDRLGRLALVAEGLNQWRDLTQFKIHLEIEEETVDLAASAVTVANAATSETLLAQGPAAIRQDDGYLDATIVAPTGRWGAIATAADLFLSALQSRAAQREDVYTYKAKRFTLSADPVQAVVVDGEPAGETPVTITCLPKALTVWVPAA